MEEREVKIGIGVKSELVFLICRTLAGLHVLLVGFLVLYPIFTGGHISRISMFINVIAIVYSVFVFFYNRKYTYIKEQLYQIAEEEFNPYTDDDNLVYKVETKAWGKVRRLLVIIDDIEANSKEELDCRLMESIRESMYNDFMIRRFRILKVELLEHNEENEIIAHETAMEELRNMLHL